jgi:2-amino-4-hydroxy-6-hydroxymethyldihydropteridine diphosphokinase
MRDVYILLGSNRGDRTKLISQATEMIGETAGQILRESKVYISEPWGFDDPTPFLNKVVELETVLSPAELLDKLLTIEVKLCRIRPFDGCGCGVPSNAQQESPEGEKSPSYAARTIDLDILFYGGQLIFTDSLMVPHPRLHERRFTLVPLSEIAPDFVHPLLKKSIAVLLNDCRDSSKVSEF